MNRHTSRLPSNAQCLGNTCGTNIEAEDIDFSNKSPNLVYMDKVFSFNEDTANPLLFNLNTGGANRNNFVVDLQLRNCNCSLIPCTLSSNAIFTVNDSFVVVEYFNTRPPGNINASQVTVDGFNVDSVSFSNGQYLARTSNLLPRVQKERCLDEGLPTKAFFLLDNAGPWDFRAIYVLEGTVNTNGRTCCFRAEIRNAPNSTNTSLPSGSLSSFAIRNLSLPCSINGIAPDIIFTFNANINMINPRLVVNCNNQALAGVSQNDFISQCHEYCPPRPEVSPISDSCTVSLVTALAIEPTIHVETVRRTLFCVNACEALQPCQGSVRAAEAEEEAEECDIQRVPCRCGSCREEDDDEVGGTSDMRRNHRNSNNEDDAEWVRDRRRDSVLGERTCSEGLLGELCEELLAAEMQPCDCDGEGVAGLATNGTFGCDCDEVMGTRENNRRKCRKNRNNNRNDVRGTRERNKNNNNNGNGNEENVAGANENRRNRTAFQFNGTNGCCW